MASMIRRAFAGVLHTRLLGGELVPVVTQTRWKSSKLRKKMDEEKKPEEANPVPRSSDFQPNAPVPSKDRKDVFRSRFLNMFDEIEREFFGPSSPFSSTLNPIWSSEFPALSSSFGFGYMPVDLSETDERYNITLEIPGANKEEIHMNVDGDVLTISTEKKQEKTEKADKYHRVERSYGRMQRSVTLPENADVDKIDAMYEDGVLKISIPKFEVQEHRTKKIEIK